MLLLEGMSLPMRTQCEVPGGSSMLLQEGGFFYLSGNIDRLLDH